MKNRILLSQVLLWITVISLYAQPPRRPVEVIVSADHEDWTYKPGEKVQFTVQVLRNGYPVKNAQVRYEIGLEKLDPTIKETKTAADGKLTIDGGTLKTPGFLRCIAWANVDGGEFRGLATAGFDPLKIQPTVTNPEDFDKFWEDAKKELATVPMDAKMTLLPERCTEKTNVYHLSLQNHKQNLRVYGILSIPKKEGKYPALLKVPGAGVFIYQKKKPRLLSFISILKSKFSGSCAPRLHRNLGNSSPFQIFSDRCDDCLVDSSETHKSYCHISKKQKQNQLKHTNANYND